MHPSRPQPKPVLTPAQVIAHREWLSTPSIRERIETLQDSIEADISLLLSTFHGQSELDIKLKLQTIKIKQEHLVCLTTPPAMPDPQA
jgi:hypothetical protein